jgi:hypothetical protein
VRGSIDGALGAVGVTLSGMSSDHDHDPITVTETRPCRPGEFKVSRPFEDGVYKVGFHFCDGGRWSQRHHVQTCADSDAACAAAEVLADVLGDLDGAIADIEVVRRKFAAAAASLG